MSERIEVRLRELAPRVLGALVRRYGHFDACEDAVQEALLAATTQWPQSGRPDNERGWLITVASRRLTDQLRSESARRRREDVDAAMDVPFTSRAPDPADDARWGDRDDTLTLLFLCCHPILSAPSQLALTLRAVGGLTTAEIAAAFLVPETTVGQRISRAKQSIRAASAPFALPPEDEREERLRVVLHVLYLIFNEGYATSSGPHVQRADLTAEAIRLARQLHRLVPGHGEVAGLLALMLLTDAHRPARTGPDGALVPLAEQNRALWDAGLTAEGVALITKSLAETPVGPYQLQAAIAAVHNEAASAEETDWPQILALYDLLERITANPMVALNRAVAVAEVHGPAAALDVIARLEGDERISTHHRLDAARGHFLEMAGDRPAARDAFRRAARRTTSIPEQGYLEGRAARLRPG